MTKKIYIILLLCLLCSSRGFGNAAGGVSVNVCGEGDSLMRVTFVMPPLTFRTDGGFLICDGGEGMNLHGGLPGWPALPTASTVVRLPKGSTLGVAEARWSAEEELSLPRHGFPLAPVTRAWAKDSLRPPYEPDGKVYGDDRFFRGGDAIEVENLGALGRWQLFRLTVRPVAYNAVRHSLRKCDTLHAVLTAHAATAMPPVDDRTGLLVVSRPEFRDGLQPFVRWKRQEGYAVDELYVSTHKRDTVKEAMRRWFDGSDALRSAPEYVLLVGDVAQLQAFLGETSLDGVSHVTDLYYGDFTGDYLPEAMVGRWPVNDTAELRNVVEKTLRYERFAGLDTLQLKRLMLVAGDEASSPAPLTTNGQVNYLKREVALAHPDVDTVCYYNPESGNRIDDVVADIGRGMSLLNYTAHCTVGGWTSPPMSIGKVEQAEATQPSVYVNNCCKSNAFDGTGFGEQLLRLPVGGAVGVVGATNSTLWYEDYYWAVGPKWPVAAEAAFDSAACGAFDGLMGRGQKISTLGELLTAGNMAVMSFGSGYTKFYWEIYCLLGDPTLRPYIGTQQAATLALADAAHNGESSLALVGTPGAMATAMQGDSLIGWCRIGSDGRGTMTLTRTLDSLPLILTASGAGLRPCTAAMRVEMDVPDGVALRDVVVDESAVVCRVENIGRQTTDSLRVALFQTAADSALGALIAAQAVEVAPLAAGADTTIRMELRLERVGQRPLWQAHLCVWRDSLECPLTLRHGLGTVYPTVQLRLANGDGSRLRTLLPGAEYRIEAFVDGPEANLVLEAECQGVRSETTDSLLQFTTGDSLCSLRIAATLSMEGWSERKEYWIEPDIRMESFEHGMDSRPWWNGSLVGWQIDSTEYHSGSHSLRSDAVGDGQSAQICLDVELPADGEISFWVKTSTEEMHDRFVFTVDRRSQIPQAWGVTDWQQRRYTIEAGRHSLCWTYAKDGSNSVGSDCVWIDDIRFPVVYWDSAYAWACAGETLALTEPEKADVVFSVYPNPAIGAVTIEGPGGTRADIRDAMGRRVASLPLHGTTTWNTEALPAGVYFVTAIGDGRTYIKKLILLKH